MHRLVIALVALIGIAGVAFLAGHFLLLSAATDRASTMVPATTAFYANVYLQPSAGQQMNLAGLIGRLPGFADDASLDEKVDQVVQNLLGDTGVDYREQIKPWLGNQVAIAGWPAEDVTAEPIAVILADVKDPAAAEAAVAEIATSGGETFTTETHEGVDLHVSSTTAYAIVDETLLIGPTTSGIEAVIDVQGGAASLAERTDFRATMEDLPSDHLAAAFIDLAGLGEATGTAAQLDAVSTAGAALVAEEDGLRLTGSAPFDTASAAPSSQAGFALGSQPSSLPDWMPENTIAEVVVFGLRQALENAEAAAGTIPQGEEAVSLLDSLRAIAAFGLGIDIDNDILPLLEREVGIAISGLDGGMPSGQLLLRPEDPDAAIASLERIVDGVTASAGGERRTETVDGVEITALTLPDVGELAYAVTDGIVIIGFGVDDVVASLEAHNGATALSATDAYVRTFEVAGERGGNEGFLHVGPVAELLGADATLPDDARDILSQVGTFGFTSPSRDDEIVFHAVLTIDARPQ
jgi:hypothetical protein